MTYLTLLLPLMVTIILAFGSYTILGKNSKNTSNIQGIQDTQYTQDTQDNQNKTRTDEKIFNERYGCGNYTFNDFEKWVKKKNLGDLNMSQEDKNDMGFKMLDGFISDFNKNIDYKEYLKQNGEYLTRIESELMLDTEFEGISNEDIKEIIKGNNITSHNEDLINKINEKIDAIIEKIIKKHSTSPKDSDGYLRYNLFKCMKEKHQYGGKSKNKKSRKTKKHKITRKTKKHKRTRQTKKNKTKNKTRKK